MLTIFTNPKPFLGHIELIQRNSISSWLHLRPKCEIILFGNEEGLTEEKIRIVLKGSRGEVSITDFCLRKGIHTTMYYKWSEVFLEAGRGFKILSKPTESSLTCSRTSMLIIHAPHSNKSKIVKVLQPLPNEIFIDSNNIWTDDLELHSVLQKYNIETLFYVGFYTDMCVYTRPYGMENMHKLGYHTILLRDCTFSTEFNDTLEEMWMTRLAVRYTEISLGYSATSEDFIKSYRKKNAL